MGESVYSDDRHRWLGLEIELVLYKASQALGKVGVEGALKDTEQESTTLPYTTPPHAWERDLPGV